MQKRHIVDGYDYCMSKKLEWSSINNQRKVYIEYKSINSNISKRIIHPAELFNYLDDWYVAAFCEPKMAIRLFRLKDIIKPTYRKEAMKIYRHTGKI